MGFLSDVVGAFTGSAERKAGQQAALGHREAGKLYEDLLPRAEGRMQPYQQAGTNALAQYVQGINQNAPGSQLPQFQYGGQIPGYESTGQFQFDPSQLESNPAYQFRLQQGMEALNRGAGASGNLGSGNRLAELMQFGQGMASQEYDNEWQRQLTGSRENYTRGVTDYGIQAGIERDQYGRAVDRHQLGTDRANTMYGRNQNLLAHLASLAAMGYDTSQFLTNVDLNSTSGEANARVGAANAVAAGIAGGANAIRSVADMAMTYAGTRKPTT